MPSSLFAGVVTHARSRFNVNGAAAAMLGQLGSALADVGVTTELLVSDRDDYDAAEIPITNSLLAASARHQATLEHSWRRYLTAGGGAGRSSAADVLAREAMWAKRLAASLGPNPVKDPGERPGAAAAVRLLNIDLSHLRVLDAASSSGATWALVLEDDAGMQDSAGVAVALRWLIDALEPTSVAFANLSESLSPDELGVASMLRPAADLLPPAELGLSVLRASRPVTNTVCATLYRSDYARSLAEAIRGGGLVPVAPIDWRVNEAIMDLFGRGILDGQSCVWISPGLFVQRSMHS